MILCLVSPPPPKHKQCIINMVPYIDKKSSLEAHMTGEVLDHLGKDCAGRHIWDDTVMDGIIQVLNRVLDGLGCKDIEAFSFRRIILALG